MTAYNVYLKGRIIDTVFYNSPQDKQDVKKSLIEHDGYDPAIKVTKAKGQKPDKPVKALTKKRREKIFIEQYLLDCIEPAGYDIDPKTDIEKVEFVASTFKSEKQWEIDRDGPFSAFQSWLQGLCSALPIAFCNSDIIELAQKQGVLSANPTEKEQGRILERYWRYMTVRFFELYRKLTGKIIQEVNRESK